MSKLRDVTDQEYIFLDHFIRTGDKVAAVTTAYPPGESGRTRRQALQKAQTILSRPAVKAEQAKMRQEFQGRMRLSREQHILNLVRLRDNAEESARNANSLRDKNSLLGTALKAEVAIGKALGYAEQKIKIEREVDASQALDQLGALIESSPALANVLRKKVGPGLDRLLPATSDSKGMTVDDL